MFISSRSLLLQTLTDSCIHNSLWFVWWSVQTYWCLSFWHYFSFSYFQFVRCLLSYFSGRILFRKIRAFRKWHTPHITNFSCIFVLPVPSYSIFTTTTNWKLFENSEIIVTQVHKFSNTFIHILLSSALGGLIWVLHTNKESNHRENGWINSQISQ